MAIAEIRPLSEADEPEVLELLAASMGWSVDERYAEFFRWKHRDNPFGPSPGWVAVEGERIVGLRVFLRWRFHDGEREYGAVRAVDTATHPDHRGKGIFRRLTEHALEQLDDEGVDFVFNTPNAQSKPGYLKMGWQEIGVLPVTFSVKGLGSVPRVLRSRAPAQREPEPTDVGAAASEHVLDAVRPLLPVGAPPGILATPRTEAFFAWRYGLEQLGYRVWAPEMDANYGVVIFRLRRRGRAIELVVNDVLTPPGISSKRLISRLVKRTKADHSVALAAPGSKGAVRPPGVSPTLTWKGLRQREAPAMERWYLTMGDVELL